jgi:hypothetical protein
MSMSIADHESLRTTKLHDLMSDAVSLDEYDAGF